MYVGAYKGGSWQTVNWMTVWLLIEKELLYSTLKECMIVHWKEWGYSTVHWNECLNVH